MQGMCSSSMRSCCVWVGNAGRIGLIRAAKQTRRMACTMNTTEVIKC